MAGEGNDPDDLIVQAFKAYDNEGKIDSKMFEHALKTWGDKMTKAEIDDIFGEFEIDEDYIIFIYFILFQISNIYKAPFSQMIPFMLFPPQELLAKYKVLEKVGLLSWAQLPH